MRQDELLTTGDVAKMIGRSARTVSRLVKDGDIPYAERLNAANGIYLIRRSAVIAYLARTQKQEAAS
jgi:excisionase family DNA binding protein